MAHAVRLAAYWLVQALWGLPQTLAGLVVALAFRHRARFVFHGAVVTLWGRASSMSLGPFLFLEGRPESYADPRHTHPDVYGRLLVHEYGHSVQSLVLGPLYLLAVGLPSAIWANAPQLKRRRARLRGSYYAFGPERNANWLGEKVLKLPSMGQAVID